MKLATVVALVAAGSAPVLAGTGVDWLGIDDIERVLHGENITDVAADIAQREFRSSASLRIVSVESLDETRGSWGGRIRADDGWTYHHVRVRLHNDGRMDLPVHTRHFEAVDDIGHTYGAEWGLVHLIDTASLPPGGTADGVVVFLMRDYIPLVSVVWEGDFASADADVGAAYDAPPTAAGDPPREPAPADPAPSPEAQQPPDEDEYDPHWDG